jgi:hypothetical protein
MSGGKETQTITRNAAFDQFLGQIFGMPGTPDRRIGSMGGRPGGTTFIPGTPGTEGVGLGGIGQLFGGFGQQPGPLQQQAVGNISTLLGQPAPEVQAWNLAQQGLNPVITGQGQFGNVAEALTPIFNRNLDETLAQTQAALPSVFNRAAAGEVANVGQRALQDFNLFIQQARQQDIQNRIQAALASGTLSSAAGQNPFMRNLQAGQFAQQGDMFQAQQQLAAQLAILQLLGQPTGSVTQQSGGLGGMLGGALGMFGGPFIGAAGYGLGSGLFND